MTTKSGFLGLRTTIYRVPDFQKAKDWYTEVIGTGPYFDQPFYVGFNVGGYELGLLPIENEERSQGPGGVETYWGVNDIAAEYDRLLGLGAKGREAPHNVGGPIEVATVFDPWGNIIGLIFNPEFSAGTHAPPH